MSETSTIRREERQEAKSQRATQILEIAFDCFAEEGLFAVDMKRIAERAQVSRATLYRYFPSKQDLAFAVLQHIAVRDFIPKYIAQRRAFTGTGRERFAQFLGQLVHAYRSNAEFFRFSARVSALYSSQLPAEEQAAMYRDLYSGLFLQDTPEDFLRLGQADGSVRSDIDPHRYFAMAVATVPALAQHLALNLDLARQLYGVSEPADLLEVLADGLVAGLAPTKTSDG